MANASLKELTDSNEETEENNNRYRNGEDMWMFGNRQDQHAFQRDGAAYIYKQRTKS